MEPLFNGRQSALTRAYEAGELTSTKDLEPLQLRLAWRIVRAHAICKGQMGRMELLSYIEPAKWAAPMPDASPPSRSTLGQAIADTWAGLPLLPVGRYLQDHRAAVKHSAKLIRPPGADPLFTDIFALKLHNYFPTREQLIFFEENFLGQVADAFLYKGHVKFIAEAREAYGLSRHEALALLPLVRAFVAETIELDLESDQRLMVARTESLLNRAQDAADLRAEIAGLKHLSIIQGLARIEPQDPVREFETIIREINDEPSDRKALEQKVDNDDHNDRIAAAE